MPNNSNAPATPTRAAGGDASRLQWLRREPGLAILIASVAIMLLAFLIPRETRAIMVYGAGVLTLLGIVLVLRHGPDNNAERGV